MTEEQEDPFQGKIPAEWVERVIEDDGTVSARRYCHCGLIGDWKRQISWDADQQEFTPWPLPIHNWYDKGKCPGKTFRGIMNFNLLKNRADKLTP